MPVSIAIPSLSGGGAEKVTLLLIRALARDGKVSTVYVAKPCRASESLDCNVVILGGDRASHGLPNFLKAVRKDPAQTYLLTLGYVNFAPFLRLLYPRRRIVLRIGNTPSPEIAALSSLARLRYVSSLRLATLAASEIVAQCGYMAEDLKKTFSVPDENIKVIFNPIERELENWSVAEQSPVDGPYIFVAATYKPQKDMATLLSGFAGARNSHERRLVIAGVSPDDAEFQELMVRHGLRDCEVLRLGFRADTYELISHAEICVLTSRYEGFSNFLLEAAALGKRIVATDCPGGNAELFSHYSNAITFPVGDHSRLSELIGLSRCDLPRHRVTEILAPFRFDRFITDFKNSLRIC